MDLRDYLRVARKQWRLIASTVVLAAIVAGIITVRTTPQYATTMTFFITTPSTGVNDAYQGGLFSQQRVKSYASLLTGDRVATAVSQRAEIGLSASQIRKRITAEPLQETVLLQATVTDNSRSRSLLIAQELAKQFKALVESLETPPDRTSSSVKVEVVVGPELNDTPVAPRPYRNLALGLMIGLIVGLGSAILREILDTTVKSVESLQQLTSVPVLASVPFDTTAKSDPLLIGEGSRSPRAEALRQLRTNLQFVDVDRPVKVLVVTSAIPGEGKSSTACNLAILFAETGKRVLLIDADLRRPRIADYLGIEGAAGLTTVLAGQSTVDEVLQRWGSNVWVLPSGFLPPNPSELLGSQHMADLLDASRQQFDMVVIDCPPLLPVTDGAIVAARSDGALMIARSHKTTSGQVSAAARSLTTVDARLLGCVFNMVQAIGKDTYYTYYGYGTKPDNARPGRAEADDQLTTTSLTDLLGEPEPAATAEAEADADVDTEVDVEADVEERTAKPAGSKR